MKKLDMSAKDAKKMDRFMQLGICPVTFPGGNSTNCLVQQVSAS